MSNVPRTPELVNHPVPIRYVYVSATAYEGTQFLPSNEMLVLLWLTAINRREYVREQSHRDRFARGRVAANKQKKSGKKGSMGYAAAQGYRNGEWKQYAEPRLRLIEWPSLSAMLSHQGLQQDTRVRERLWATLCSLQDKGYITTLVLEGYAVQIVLSKQWVTASHGKTRLPLPYPLRLKNPLTMGLWYMASNNAWFVKFGKSFKDPISLAQSLGPVGQRVVGRPRNAAKLLMAAAQEASYHFPEGALRVAASSDGYVLDAHRSARTKDGGEYPYLTEDTILVPGEIYEDCFVARPVIKRAIRKMC